MSSLSIRTASLVALAALSGCAGHAGTAGEGPSPTPSPAPPVIQSFAARPPAIAQGGTSELLWSVAGATSLSIDQGVGPVAGTRITVRPAATTTFTLTASNAIGNATASTTVTVGGGGGGVCNGAPGQLFPPGAPWNQAVDAWPLDPESDAIIAYLVTNHTAAARFQITFDFNVLFADASTPHRAFTPTGDFYDPDCDPAPAPVPSVGRLEGEGDYFCSTDGDCHLTVVDTSTCRLHELWRASIAGGASTGTFTSGCQAIWDLSTTPPDTGRGDFCTSADAAGLPIVPLLFSADEVAAGTIDHALRFILPNAFIRRFIYVRPGTHSTSATGGGSTAPPYTTRLRLKASKDLAGLAPGAQVIARALKKYGMLLADGGNVTFTAATDDLTAHKWSEVGVGASSLKSLSWNDFEVVDLGARIDYRTGSCSRTPITR